MADRARRIPRPLLLLQLVAVVQVLAWSVALPPLQGPDETWHAAYAQRVAETGEGPHGTQGTFPMSWEHSQLVDHLGLGPTVGVLTALPARSEVDRARWERFEPQLTDADSANGDGPNPVAQNPPLYYAWEALAYLAASPLDAIDRLFVMKLANALLYLATIAFVWLLAGELFPRRRDLQTLATACAVLLPQLAWLSAHINPDTMLVTIWTAFFWLAARMLRRGWSLRRGAGIALLAAAGALTHGRGLALVAPAVVALAIALWRARPPLRAVLAAAGVLVAALGAAAAIALVWTDASGGEAYGGEVSRSAGAVSIAGFLSYVWQFYFPRLGFMTTAPGPDYGFREVFVEGFFGTFASLEVRYPGWIYDALQVGWLVAFALLLVLVARRLRARWPLVATFGAGVLALLALLHRVAYDHLQSGSGDPIIQGRYVLPLAALFAVGVAALAGRLPPRWSRVAAVAVVVVGALLQVAGIGLTFARFYG